MRDGRYFRNAFSHFFENLTRPPGFSVEIDTMREAHQGCSKKTLSLVSNKGLRLLRRALHAYHTCLLTLRHPLYHHQIPYTRNSHKHHSCPANRHCHIHTGAAG